MDTEKHSTRYPWELYVVAMLTILWGGSWYITYRMTGAFHDKYGNEYRGREAVAYSLTALGIGIALAAWSLVISRRVWKTRKKITDN
jgi:hypothetical protein